MFIKSRYFNHYYKIVGIRNVVSESKHLAPLGYQPSYRITVIYDTDTCKIRTTQSLGPETPGMSESEIRLFAYIHPVTTKMVVEDIMWEMDTHYLANRKHFKLFNKEGMEKCIL